MLSDQVDMISNITEENKRRKRKRIILTELYFISQKAPRSSANFSDDEHKYTVRKYLLKDMYDGSEVACYDQLRLTKINFHDLCTMLHERCGLRGSVYVTVEEKVSMFLLVVGHGLKMRLL